MPTSRAYRDLDAWRASMTVVEKTYAATRRFPDDERFGLTAQVRRASVSMPANIAEGWSRRSLRAYANHVGIALGSHAEVETCFEIAKRLSYISERELNELTASVDQAGRLLAGLFRSLATRVERT
jgi:four helix bundle protein